MVSLITLLLLGGPLAFLGYHCFKKVVFEGEVFYVVYFLVAFLSFNATLQIVVFDVTGSVEIAGAISYLKELFLLIAISSWLFYQRNVFTYDFRLYRYDYVALFFLVIVLAFYILPIGEASFANKTIYLKNLLVLALMYFLGRNAQINENHVVKLAHLILIIIVVAFPVALLEKLLYTHFQSVIGYTDYVIAKGGEPTGRFGLQYTFQASSGAKRFASIFASPLEMATVAILAISAAFILYRTNMRLRLLYVFAGIMAFCCLFFSFSRAPIAAFFLMLVYIGYLYGYWRYILGACVLMFFFILIPFFFGSQDLRFFIIDTITFADPSSMGHVLDWVIGIESMVSNPEGIGMATSGNAGGVDEALQVGGENQFIVFGVQFGVLGMLLYLWLTVKSITLSKKVFKSSTGKDQVVPFITTTFKVAFLLSLMTANAEIYNAVAYLSWWMVGYSIQRLSVLNHKSTESQQGLLTQQV
ncbi:O-antigen ligase family protein [Roseivirga pacifica]